MPGEEPRSGWDGFLAPAIWVPVGAILAITAAVLGVFLAIGGGGDGNDDPPLTVCQPGDPSCALRQDVHWHADIALYIRGERFDFGTPDIWEREGFTVNENVHMHPPDFEVVHIHKEQSTWREFLTSFYFEVSDECIVVPDGTEYCSTDTEKLSFVVNGVQVDSILALDASDLHRVLINYGPETGEELLARFQDVGDFACIASELCLDRLPPGGNAEEPCAGRGTCN
jgi:hypothetical protein